MGVVSPAGFDSFQVFAKDLSWGKGRRPYPGVIATGAIRPTATKEKGL